MPHRTGSVGWVRGVVPALLLLTACGGGSPPRPSVEPAPRVGSLAPALGGTSLEGHRVTLDALRGAPVVVVFWASWCGPCRDEQPTLNRIAQRSAANGVHFVGVAVHDEAGAARSYVRDLAVPYDTLLDSNEALVAEYLISGPPATFVVDRAGRITARLSGPVNGDELVALLRTAAG